MVEDETCIWSGLDQFHEIGKIPRPDHQLAMQSDFAQELHATRKAMPVSLEVYDDLLEGAL